MAQDNRDSRAASAATQISYCPCLRIYHYRRADGLEAFFNEERLEASIEAYIKQGKPADAEFMALLTGFGRQYPHELVTFDENGKMTHAPAQVVASTASASADPVQG